MTKSKKINWALILGVPGTLAALASVFTFAISKDFRCSIAHIVGIKSEQCSDTTILPNINLLVSTDTGEPIEGAEIDFIGNDTPEPRYTDKNGFVQARIKNEGSVIARIRAKNYPIEDLTINASAQQITTREIRLSKSGTPTVTDLNPKTTQPTPTEVSTISSPSTNPPSLVLPATQIFNSVSFQLDSCTRKQSDVVSCHLSLISNQDATYYLGLTQDTRIVDNMNNPYYAVKGYIGKYSAGSNNFLGLYMIKDGHSNVIIDFNVSTPISQILLLNIGLYNAANPGNNVGSVQFRNVPIK